MSKSIATLSLGGNQGDARTAFAYALARLAASPCVDLVAKSHVWRTPPWGKTDQPDFLNMAALVRVDLSASALLELCLAIELERGRERTQRWGPRTLDIDIIAFGGLRIDEPGLIVPHPRAKERAFVLGPLAQIAPDLMIDGEPVSRLLASLDLGEAHSIGPL